MAGGTDLYEFASSVFVALAMLSFGYGYLRDGHVRIDVIRERMPPRWIAWIELGTCLAVLVPVSALLVAYGAEAAWRSLVQGERLGGPMGLPLQWAVRATVPVGFLWLLLAAVAVVFRNGLFLAGRADRPAPVGREEAGHPGGRAG